MVMTILHRYVDSGRVAKEVVHITQNLLIGTHEEHAQIVGLVLLQRMDGQRVRVMTVGHETGNLAVAVAGDILQRGVTCGTLVQSLDRHDGEHLVDSP